jgi:hypothetical protein
MNGRGRGAEQEKRETKKKGERPAKKEKNDTSRL